MSWQSDEKGSVQAPAKVTVAGAKAKANLKQWPCQYYENVSLRLKFRRQFGHRQSDEKGAERRQK